MRHKVKTKKIGRTKSHRNAMIANVTASLLVNEYVVTTIQKAKLCKAFTDRLISIGKKDDLYSRRRVLSLLRDKNATNKIFEVYEKRFVDRVGGFVSIKRLGNRKGDNAQLAKLIMVGSSPYRIVKKVKVRKKKAEPKKVDKVKNEPTMQSEKKQSVFDRVKSLRGRLTGARDMARQEPKDDRIGGKVERKSRSGI